MTAQNTYPYQCIMKTPNEPYRDFIRYFQGFPITFRHFLKSGSIYIRVDEHFARANVYRTLAELTACVPLLRGFDWMDAALLETDIILPVS